MTSLRPFRSGLVFGGFNALTWTIGLGTPMVLLAEQLGASAFQVGLASSFAFLLLPVQVVSTTSLARLGYRRQMMLGWSLRAIFLLAPLAFAWQAPPQPEPWMASAFVASLFGFCLLRSFGSAAHIPWFTSILPLAVRGRFFATDSAITGLVGVATLLLCSGLFARLPPYNAFFVVYCLAMLGSLGAVSSLSRLPDATPAPTPLRSLHLEVHKLIVSPGLFRHYLILSLLSSVVTSAIAGFSVYYLKVEAGLASSRILIFTAVQFAGTIAGAWGVRPFIDGVAIGRLFQLGALIIGSVDAFWLALLLGAGVLQALLPLAYFAFGLATGIWSAAHLTLLPDLAPPERRPVSIAAFTATLGIFSGLAPSLWGLALKKQGLEPGIDLPNFTFFFALGVVLSALSALLFARLSDTRHMIE